MTRTYRESARIVENPISGRIVMVGNPGCKWTDGLRLMADIIANPEYQDRSISFFANDTALELPPSPERDKMNGVDVMAAWIEVYAARHGDNIKATLRSFDIKGEDNGIIQAELKKEYVHPIYTIYDIAVDAALLSRENGNKPITFTWRDKTTVTVDGATDPKTIDAMFQGDDKLAADYDRPKPPAYSSGYGYGYGYGKGQNTPKP